MRARINGASMYNPATNGTAPQKPIGDAKLGLENLIDGAPDPIVEIDNPRRRRGKVSKRMLGKAAMQPRVQLTGFLSESGVGRTNLTCQPGDRIYAQGEKADAVYCIQKGQVKITVVSQSGKEAVIAILGEGDFFGEGCLADQQHRTASATAFSLSKIMRLERDVVVEEFRAEPAFAGLLLSYMLTRTIRIEEDLVDQLLNSSEKRLARALLLLANFGKEGKPQTVIPKISHETLAEMIGTTRSRVSFFMNKFRRRGFIKYNGTLEVHSSLLSVVLDD